MYLQRAKRCIVESNCMDDVARKCGVARSTAFNYCTILCEKDEEVCRHVLDEHTSFVCKTLVDAFGASDLDITGSLSDLMGRLDDLNGCPEWRSERNRWEQLRLLRVCMTRQ